VILTRSFEAAAHITLLEIVLLQAGDLHESAKQSPWLISMDWNHDPPGGSTAAGISSSGRARIFGFALISSISVWVAAWD
jgi:hypothetical protein